MTAKTFASESRAKEWYLDIDWNPNVIRLTRQGLAKGLRRDEASVGIRLCLFSGGRIQLSAPMLDEGGMLSLAK